eukprot:1925932-Pleurochrysis_carterae.AAC.1
MQSVCGCMSAHERGRACACACVALDFGRTAPDDDSVLTMPFWRVMPSSCTLDSDRKSTRDAPCPSKCAPAPPLEMV